jgi:hypothetical protein
MQRALCTLVLLAAAGCSRCGETARKPELPGPGGAAAASGAAGEKSALSPECLGPEERVQSCEDTEVKFSAAERVTVRLCRLQPHDDPGEPPDGRSRFELRAAGKRLACGKLGDVASLAAICSGPEEAACLGRIGQDNLVPGARFWAPKRFAGARLIAFFGDALDADTPSVELVQLRGGAARTVFYSEPGRTERPFVFSQLEDLDGDGVPELLGWEAVPELDVCQPYTPLAIFTLGENGYTRNEALMEKWARAHGKAWRGPEPDPSIRECDEEADAERPPAPGGEH